MNDETFTINDWLVETRLCQISKDAEVVPLEPQVMKVLACLIENAGDVVTKQYLADTLWRSNIVSDAALARCISQIRVAIGDDRKKPQFIQTIPKVGYRLIANVDRPASGKPNTQLAELFASGVAIAATVTLIFLFFNQPVLPPSLSIASIDIETTNDPSQMLGLSSTAEAINLELRRGLSDLRQQIVIADGVEPPTFGTMPVTEFAGFVLRGRMRQDAARIEYEFAITNADESTTVWKKRYSSLSTDPFAIVADIVGNVADYFEVDLSFEMAQNLANAPTRNVDAFLAYHKAHTYFMRSTYVENENAIDLFKSAIEKDSRFGLAHAGLAHALAMDVRHWNGTRRDEAIASAEKAIELIPEVADGYHAFGDAMTVSGSPDLALNAYTLALEKDPQHAATVFEIANIHFGQLRFPEAKSFYLRSLELQPNMYHAMSRLGFVYLKSGHIDDAKYWLDQALQQAPLHASATAGMASIEMVTGHHISAAARCEKVTATFPLFYDCLETAAVAKLLHFDLPAARDAFRNLAELRPNDGYAFLGEAQILMAESKHEEAMLIVDHVLQYYKERVSGTNVGWRDYWMIAASYALRGERKQAYVWLDKAVEAGRRNYLWDSADPVFAKLRNDQQFSQYIQRTKTDVW